MLEGWVNTKQYLEKFKQIQECSKYISQILHLQIA